MSKTIKARFSINVVQNTDDEVLLLKRSDNAKLGPGLWGFPAGHIEPGESSENCAMRELREEIGTDFSIALIQRFGPVRDTQYGGIYEIFLFHYRWLQGEVILNEEHTDFAWADSRIINNYELMPGIKEDIEYLGIWP